MNVLPGQYKPVPGSFESIPVTDSAVVSLNPPALAKVVLIQVLNDDVNWRDDGTDPTNAPGGGMILHVEGTTNGFLTSFTGDLKQLRFISTVDTGSVILATYYG
jgi:hypothetical protein